MIALFITVLAFFSANLQAMQRGNELGRVEEFAPHYMLESSHKLLTRGVVDAYYASDKSLREWHLDSYDWSERYSCLFDTTGKYLEIKSRVCINLSRDVPYDDGMYTHKRYRFIDVSFLIDTEKNTLQAHTLPSGSKPQEQIWINKDGWFKINKILFSADRQMAIGYKTTGFLGLGDDVVDIYIDGNEPKLKKICTLAKYTNNIKALALSDDNKKIAVAGNGAVQLYTLKKYLEQKKSQQK